MTETLYLGESVPSQLASESMRTIDLCVEPFNRIGALPCRRVHRLFVIGERLWAVCEVERRWWQFWRPRTFLTLIDATPYIEPGP